MLRAGYIRIVAPFDLLRRFFVAPFSTIVIVCYQTTILSALPLRLPPLRSLLLTLPAYSAPSRHASTHYPFSLYTLPLFLFPFPVAPAPCLLSSFPTGTRTTMRSVTSKSRGSRSRSPWTGRGGWGTSKTTTEVCQTHTYSCCDGLCFTTTLYLSMSAPGSRNKQARSRSSSRSYHPMSLFRRHAHGVHHPPWYRLP